MKRSNIWFASILIASALLLSAASPSPEPSLKPSPRPAEQPNESAALGESQSKQSPSPINNADTRDGAPPNNDTGADQNNSDHDIADIVIAIFTVVSGVATIFIAKFNRQLVRITDEMKQATADAARAAKDSARAAEESAKLAKIALDIEKPHLVAESVELLNFAPASIRPRNPVTAKFALRNHGRGTAVAPYVHARLDIVELDLPRSILHPPKEPHSRQHPRLGNHFRCEHVLMRDQAIPAGTITQAYTVILGGEEGWFDRKVSFLSDNTYATLNVEWIDKEGPSIEIGLHIVIRCRDVAGNEHTTESIWLYSPSRIAEEPGHFWLSKFGD